MRRLIRQPFEQSKFIIIEGAGLAKVINVKGTDELAFSDQAMHHNGADVVAGVKFGVGQIGLGLHIRDEDERALLADVVFVEGAGSWCVTLAVFRRQATGGARVKCALDLVV